MFFVQVFWFHIMILLLKNMPVLVEFHKKHVPRELITRTIENTQDKDQGEENVELFCYRETLYDELNHILVVMM